jgi:hypothetical protein
MARENFLWGAPRIHGELLMLGFTVSQATVSRYMPPASRRPGQSWRTFIHNQILAFRHDRDSEESTGDDAALRVGFNRGTLLRNCDKRALHLRLRPPAGCFQRSSNFSLVRAAPSPRGVSGTAPVDGVGPLMASAPESSSDCRTNAQYPVSSSRVTGVALGVDSGDHIGQ